MDERAQQPTLTLNDGHQMPQLGLGLMRIGDVAGTGSVVDRAYEVGFRLFDTASAYGNEREAGTALRQLPCGRDGYFLTTKLWNAYQEGEKPREQLLRSLELLGLDWLDLYLIHWPVPMHDTYLHAWEMLIRLREEGLTRSIGVSNFAPAHLTRIINATSVAPSVNQVEMHPYFQQAGLRNFHQQHGIVTQAWSPLGSGVGGGTGGVPQDPTVAEIARKHDCSPVQVVIAWHLAIGASVIPKATSEKHLQDNFNATKLSLDADDIALLSALDKNDGRTGPDPDMFNLVGDLPAG